MEKQFLFIEEGSIEYPYLKKFLENSGLTDANIINYKQGAPKPELVSVKNDAPQLSKAMILAALNVFLENRTETQSYHESNPATMVDRDVYLTIYQGTTNDFMDNFKEYLSKKYEQ